jgi:hypothetical protein
MLHDYAITRTIMLIGSHRGLRLAFAIPYAAADDLYQAHTLAHTPGAVDLTAAPTRTISQRALYRAGLLSGGRHGSVSGGRRLSVGQGTVGSTEPQRESQ